MADKSLFGRLKRLFSTNVIVRNVGGRKLKVADTEFIQSKIKSPASHSGGVSLHHQRVAGSALLHKLQRGGGCMSIFCGSCLCVRRHDCSDSGDNSGAGVLWIAVSQS